MTKTKTQQKNSRAISLFFTKLADKTGRPWSSKSRFYVAFHLTLFMILWTLLLVSVNNRELDERFYIDPYTPSEILPMVG